ncbi:(2Fe-2S)-binding protein [Leeuwenhoekiella sp. A16]|uniref:(2Fe-2S)-binding protein n=1 Tax=unclassified Leeuwenhoekiella TaxID=2615029 RepID=UPI003A8081AF
MKLNLIVNNEEHVVEAEPDTPLLYVLRNQLRLNGPKFGCGLQQCGACFVLADGNALPSCGLPVEAATQLKITTMDGLATADGKLHKVQQAFVDEQAAQCGYCLNGLVMASVDLLSKNAAPSEEEIRQKLERNICRCGIHTRAVRAVKKASRD